MLEWRHRVGPQKADDAPCADALFALTGSIASTVESGSYVYGFLVFGAYSARMLRQSIAGTPTFDLLADGCPPVIIRVRVGRCANEPSVDPGRHIPYAVTDIRSTLHLEATFGVVGGLSLCFGFTAPLLT